MTHEGRSHEAHEDKPPRRRNSNAFNWLAWSVTRGRLSASLTRWWGSDVAWHWFPTDDSDTPRHRGTEMTWMSRGSGGGAWRARCARRGERPPITSGTTASGRLWLPCRLPHRSGPVGRAPPAHVPEWAHAAPRFRAPRFVISHRRAPWTGRWRHGSSVPRRLVCRGQREERASGWPAKYVGVDSAAWATRQSRGDRDSRLGFYRVWWQDRAHTVSSHSWKEAMCGW